MIRVKLKLDDLIYLKLAMECAPISRHQPLHDLLHEHAAEFQQFFDKLVQSAKKERNVKFTSLQALAFMKIWEGQPLPDNKSRHSILKLMADFDRKSKQPKYLR